MVRSNVLFREAGAMRPASSLLAGLFAIDGIFHACFVATRVHLAITRLLASGLLSELEAKLALERRDNNAEAGRNSIEELNRHARLTALREKVLDTLRAYWAGAPAH